MCRPLLFLAFGLVLVGCSNEKALTAEARTVSPALEAVAGAATAEEKLVRLNSLVEEHKDSKDPEKQDLVAEARIRSGYILAQEGEFDQAKKSFDVAADEYRGTGAIEPGYGSLDDQAAYQAAVCLAADGKTEEAEKAFLDFLKNRPLSPLVHAVHRRLVKALKPGESRESLDTLLQTAMTKQEEWSKRELANCGPRVIEYYAKHFLGKEVDFDALRKSCGTDDDGTSMAGMAKGFEGLSVRAVGMELSYKDIHSLEFPAVLLHEDHYVLLLKIEDKKLHYYDPMYKSRQSAALPTKNQDSFLATVLALRPDNKSNQS